MKTTSQVRGRKSKLSKVKNRKDVFQEEYFTKYYSKMTGNFEWKDFIRNYNWFYGWFDAIQDWYDFRHGKSRKVLEIGCSIGSASALLSERGFDVTASDISEFAIKKAKKILPDIKFIVLDVDKVPTKTLLGQFDLIFGFEVIEHIEDPLRALKNLKRMLKKNGKIICSTPYPYAYTSIDKTHVSVQYPSEWVETFEQAGFRNIKWKHVGFVPFFYRWSKFLHFRMPFGLPTPYVNSTIFIYAQSK